MVDEYVYSTEELELPEFAGMGEVKAVYIQYLAERIVTYDEGNASEWLNRKALDGWRLISVDGGVAYFQRDQFVLYEVTPHKMVRIKPGRNS